MTASDLIRGNEGERLRPYTDTVGKITIGVGRNLTDNGISESECEILLQNDLDAASRGLDAWNSWTGALNEPRRAAMLDLVFNLGTARLATFTTFLGLMEAGAYDKAADDLLATLYAKQVGERATQNAQIIRTGEWPT